MGADVESYQGAGPEHSLTEVSYLRHRGREKDEDGGPRGFDLGQRAS